MISIQRAQTCVGLLALAALGACDSQADRTAASNITRSAVPIPARVREVDGIRLLEHAVADLDRAPMIPVDTAPVTIIDDRTAEPGFELTGTRRVALLSDGRVATLSFQPPKVLVFSTDGRGAHVFGRRGAGPGDFAFPFGLLVMQADTLIVPDVANRRLSWLVPDSGVVATRPWPRNTPQGLSRIAGMLRDGSAVLEQGGAMFGDEGKPGEITRIDDPIVVLDRANSTEIARIPDREIAVLATRYQDGPSASSFPIRFSRRAHVVVWDSVIATTSDDSYRIDLRSRDGKIRSAIQIPRPRRAVTPAMRDAEINADVAHYEVMAAAGKGTSNLEESKRLARERPSADSLPHFLSQDYTAGMGALFATFNKILWVVDAVARTDSEWTATAFRQDGAIVGRLRVQGKGEPVAFSDDRVVVLQQDAEENLRFRIYRFTLPR
jgi:hypothetical protein